MSPLTIEGPRIPLRAGLEPGRGPSRVQNLPRSLEENHRLHHQQDEKHPLQNEYGRLIFPERVPLPGRRFVVGYRLNSRPGSPVFTPGELFPRRTATEPVCAMDLMLLGLEARMGIIQLNQLIAHGRAPEDTSPDLPIPWGIHGVIYEGKLSTAARSFPDNIIMVMKHNTNLEETAENFPRLLREIRRRREAIQAAVVRICDPSAQQPAYSRAASPRVLYLDLQNPHEIPAAVERAVQNLI